MIDQLVGLAESLELNWSREHFPKMAFDLLSQFKFSLSLEEFEKSIAQWLLQSEKIPDQVNLYNSFGEPPITLFNNEKFAIDLYFWRKNDTLIHSHAFRGAFRVLFGKSLHEEFSIKITDKVEKDLVCSQVSTRKIEVLNTGEVRTILPGMSLVHRILHLDDPTITLCLRTVDDLELSQWHHLSTGISYEQRNMTQATIKRILYFQYMYYANAASAKIYLEQMLDQMDVSSQLSLYESLFQNEFGLEHDVSCLVIDTIHSRFVESKWFSLYEDHYREVDKHLLEYQASKGSLKILAHAINCKYSVKNTEQILKAFTSESLSSLCQDLLNEKGIFLEEHKALQNENIKKYLKA